MENVKCGCEKCGGRFELSTRTGRTAAKYGMCPKCMSKELVDNYRNLKFGLEKIKGFIPFLVVYPCYRHYNRKNGMSEIKTSDIKITFNGTELTKFDGGFFTIDEPNTGSKIDRIEHAIKYGMQKIIYRNFLAFQSSITKDKECIYSEYFTYASKLPKSQRFGKSSMILAQVLNLMKYKDSIDMFKPLKFNPILVEI